jgi:hypothetical protein
MSRLGDYDKRSLSWLRHKRGNQDSLVRLELYALDNLRGAVRTLAPGGGYVLHGGGADSSPAGGGVGDLRD